MNTLDLLPKRLRDDLWTEFQLMNERMWRLVSDAEDLANVDEDEDEATEM